MSETVALPDNFIEGSSLARPINIDKNEIPQDVRAKISELKGPKPAAFIYKAIETWALIFLTIALALHIDNVFFSALAIIFIATRQNILGLLVHEQAHSLAFKGVKGDIIGNLLAAYPLLLLTVENYARTHLAHHRYYFTDKDPDFYRKNGEDWSFPLTKNQVMRLLSADVTGLNIIKLIKSKKKDMGVVERAALPGFIKPAFYIVAAILLTYFELWGAFLLYWILPLLTVFQLIVRLGAICEHKYNIISTDVMDTTPIIIPKTWERILLPNLNFSYHVYHHLYPSISFSNLPKVHQVYEQEGYVNKESIFHGYLDYLKYMGDPKNK